MDNWDEVRTAFQVARLGTVSGAADALGVHHATVIRHIDSLEARLGAKLFQRHARGYTATEAGEDLLMVAKTTDDQFQQLAGRIRGRRNDVTGELVVTSLVALSPSLTNVLISFQEKHPDLVVRFLTGNRVFRLEYGEAHVALRAGNMPEEPDNVVQPFSHLGMSLYASKSYVEKYGLPASEDDLKDHRFVGHDHLKSSRAPFERWLNERVPEKNIVFRATDMRVLIEAVQLGAGLGFVPVLEAQNDPNFVEVMKPKPEWQAPLWLVTHVDLHRTAKVQAFLTHLKTHAIDCD